MSNQTDTGIGQIHAEHSVKPSLCLLFRAAYYEAIGATGSSVGAMRNNQEDKYGGDRS
jgi:hypothetical protein